MNSWQTKSPFINKILTYLVLFFLTLNEVVAQPTLPGMSNDGFGNVDDSVSGISLISIRRLFRI
jgi:hypothetical protein